MQGLYVHIPFCSARCRYCGFVSFPDERKSIPRYVRAVLREAELYPGFRPDTLYVGGGTPTELPAGELEALLGGLTRRFGGRDRLREFTVEVNPESADPARLDALRRSGATRVSLGLQASQDRFLAALGRRHTWADFQAAFRGARSRGFSLSVDLMLDLPGQSLADAAETVDRVVELGPEHVSAYGLHVEEGTPLFEEGARVDEDLSREMLSSAVERLKAGGYRHYEISNFARPGHEALHNVNYWRGGPYLGLGCGAAGYIEGTRWQNEERLGTYLARVERGERPVASFEKLDGRERLGEAAWLGLRMLEGHPLRPETEAAFGVEIRELRGRGLLVVEGRGRTRRMRLSREGRFLADRVFQAFVPSADGG